MLSGLAALVLIPACASNQRLLRVFFDGVPDPPGATTEEADPGDTEQAEEDRRPAPMQKVYLHGPYEAKQCEICHESASANRLALPKSEICRQCHEPETAGKTVVHGPWASGQCAGCHDPHLSRIEHLLLDQGADLCTRCHDRNTFPALEEHREDTGGECLECHEPHASESPYLLR